MILLSFSLWDNLDTHQIITVIEKFISTDGKIRNTKRLAEEIALEAEKKSNEKTYMSPFAKKALSHGYKYVGGKPDDITVIVAQLKDQSPFNHNLL